MPENMNELLDKTFVGALADKSFVANSKDRASNTDKILTKLDELPKEFPSKLQMSIEGVEVITLKGDKGEKGDQGDKGDKGDKGEQGEKGKDSTVPGPKGEKGDQGEPGKDGLDGDDGLNGTDGKDGSPDTAEQIVEKLKTIKDAWLEITSIQGFEEYMRAFGGNFLEQAKAFVPRTLDSLYDVQVRSTIANGQSLVYNAASQKWIPGSASVGGMSPLTVTGTVDGTNQTFTVASKPSVVYVDGIAMQEKDNNNGTQWSYSAGTLTLSTPPPTNAIFAYA